MAAYFGSFNAPSALATTADYAAHPGITSTPTNILALLAAATGLVLDATNQAYYAVDPNDGTATDTQIANALRDATIIQAAAWSVMGYDPLTGGVPQTTVVQSSKAGGASDTFADAAAAASARVAAVNGLVPAALRVLRYNNLLIPAPWVFG